MNTLFRVNINWNFFLVFAILLFLLFPNLSWYSYFVILVSMHQFMLLFYSFGYVIPVRYLFGSLMCLQMFIGPMFAYNGLDKFQVGRNTMQIPEAEYFAYVIPAVICFIIGLHITNKRLEGEIIEREKVGQFIDLHPNMPFILIGLGFVASFAAGFFGSEFAFVFYLIGGFKYIGAFMLVLSKRRLKLMPLVIVYGSIILSSLVTAMFHDLLIWLIFLAAIFAIKFQPGVATKLLLSLGFVIFSVIIQLIKGDYRIALGEKGHETGLQTFAKAYEERYG